jgi:hypothetical protein
MVGRRVDARAMDIMTRTQPPRSLAVLLASLLVAVSLLGPMASAATAAPSPATGHFRDVPVSSPHAIAIGEIAAAGITRGCRADHFCPGEAVTRAQVGSLLARTLGLEARGGVPFRDVDRSSTHAPGIAALAEAGIVTGCRSRDYCPDQPVTRAQMASLLARAFEFRAASTSPTFRDLRGGVHDDAIRAIAGAGITRGCTAQQFCGADDLTRAQFASFLYRAAEDEIRVASQGNGRTDRGNGRGKGPTKPPTTAPEEPAAPDEPDLGDEPVATPPSDGSSDEGTGPVPEPDAPGDTGPLPDDDEAGASDGSQDPNTGTDPDPEPDAPGDAGSPPDDDEVAPAEPTPSAEPTRLLFGDGEVGGWSSVMGGAGPFFVQGDAGHGGSYSPGDGVRSLALAEEFLAEPGRSYWSQSGLPFSSGDGYPSGMVHVRPLHAAWVWMTVPEHPDRDRLGAEVKALLLAHADDSTLDYWDGSKYPISFPDFAPTPIFQHAQWMTRLIKARDMLGRESFSAAENARFDSWLHGYANWTASWLHHETYGKRAPGRLARDYSVVTHSRSSYGTSYDGGPLIGRAARAYSNRQAAVASTMSLAANYLAAFEGPTGSRQPAYGRYSVTELLDHSRLFVEETLRFSVFPQGVQGDFERGDATRHSASAHRGWTYSVNVLNNLLEIAQYHAARGDLSVWEYGTTAGYDGSAGVPVAGGFSEKNLHFYAWAMSRYANDGWGRTNRGEPLAPPGAYNDVIPAAIASKFAPDDQLLRAAWRREGLGFHPYSRNPEPQGAFHAHYGEGAKTIGLLEHTGR